MRAADLQVVNLFSHFSSSAPQILSNYFSSSSIAPISKITSELICYPIAPPMDAVVIMVGGMQCKCKASMNCCLHRFTKVESISKSLWIHLPLYWQINIYIIQCLNLYGSSSVSDWYLNFDKVRSPTEVPLHFSTYIFWFCHYQEMCSRGNWYLFYNIKLTGRHGKSLLSFKLPNMDPSTLNLMKYLLVIFVFLA